MTRTDSSRMKEATISHAANSTIPNPRLFIAHLLYCNRSLNESLNNSRSMAPQFVPSSEILRGKSSWIFVWLIFLFFGNQIFNHSLEKSTQKSGFLSFPLHSLDIRRNSLNENILNFSGEKL